METTVTFHDPRPAPGNALPGATPPQLPPESTTADLDVTVGPAVVAGLLVAGAVLVSLGVYLLHAGAAYEWNGTAPTCAGSPMSPGDVCLSWGRRGSYDYQEGIQNAVRSGRFLRAVAGMVLGGLGAAALYAASTLAGRRTGRLAAADTALVLGIAATVLAAIGTGPALVAAACAAALAVMSTADIAIPLGRATYYLTGLALIGSSAALITAGTRYRRSQPDSGAGLGDNLGLAVSDLIQQHGALLYYAVALIAVLIAWRCARTSLDGLPRTAAGDHEFHSDKTDQQLQTEHGLILTPLTPAVLRRLLWFFLAVACLPAAGWLGLHTGSIPGWFGATALAALAGIAVTRALTHPPRAPHPR